MILFSLNQIKKLNEINNTNIFSKNISHFSIQSTDGIMTQPKSTFAALHSIVTGGSIQQQTTGRDSSMTTTSSKLGRALKLDSSNANIVQAQEASNGFVYIIDNVLLLPEDSNYIIQTQQSPAMSSTMSSLLGGHNSAILDFIHSLLTPTPFNISASSVLVLISVLILAIAVLLISALVLLVQKSRRNKLNNHHQQLESGLTSASSANSGSTSTTKSL